LSERTLPAVLPGLRHVQERTGLRTPGDLAGWRNLFGFLDGVTATLAAFREDVFRVDLATHIASAADATWRREHAGQPGADAGWRADADVAAAVFDACWHASILQHLNFTDPRIGAFDGPLHTRTVEEFRAADRQHIDATASRVLRAVAEHITHTRDRYPDESR